MSNHLKFSLKIFPIVFGCFMVFVAMKTEKLFFPIATDFHFTKLNRTAFKFESEGYYTLNRKCEFIGGSFIAFDKNGNKTELDEQQVRAKTTKYIPAGTEDIGEWIVDYKPEFNFQHIEFNGYYKCHPFWINEVKFVKFAAPKPIIDENGAFHSDRLEENLLLNTADKIQS